MGILRAHIFVLLVALCVIVVMIMRNDSVRLTPRGELFADIVTALLMVGMGYAIVRVFAIVVVKLGQVLGIV